MAEWYIHYDEWVLSDGAPDFGVGDVFDWRLVSFRSDGPLQPSGQRVKSAAPVANFGYQIVAEVLHLSNESCLVDIGPLLSLAARQTLPADVSEHAFVRGNVYFRLPLVTEFGLDILTGSQRWKINRIFADLTPYIEQSGLSVPDESRRQYQEIPGTWVQRAHTYILQCEEIGTGEPLQVGRSGALIASAKLNWR